MALTTEAYGPTDRNPDRTRAEWQTGHYIGDTTGTLAVTGAGELGPVHNNVAIAGSVSFHDVATAAGVTAANRILLADTAAIGTKNAESFAFRAGLVVVTTAATNDITFGLFGRSTLNPRTFGA